MTGECIVGIDIGGTKVAVGLGNAAGQIWSCARRATRECGDGDALLEAVCCMLEDLLAERRASPALIGLALPGPVDRARRCLIAALTLPELNFRDLGRYFEGRYGVPVALENDANAAALGEAFFGAGVGSHVMVYFTVSTGVGGGIVVAGRLFRGATGNAGEFGHQTILPGGPRCDCGKHGCLEALVSGPAIARRARSWALRHPESRLAALAAGGAGVDGLSAATVAALAAEGDRIAGRVWEETGYYLGIGVSHAIGALSPDTVVLGGGVTGAGDLLMAPVRRAARQHTPPHLYDSVRILPAALGENVGILGAIAVAVEAAGTAPVDIPAAHG